MEQAGQRLKKIRQEKGVSLEEVQKKTKIHLNILKALEGDSLTDISPIYLKGFLKIYCNFLGVDPKEYISDYKETQSSAREKPVVTQAKSQPQEKEKPSSFIESPKVKLGASGLKKGIKKSFVLILVALILSVGLFKLGKLISSGRGKHLAHTKQAAEGVTETKKAQASNKTKSASKPTQKQPQVVAVKPQKESAPAKIHKETQPLIRLAIRTRENCWVSLKADGKLIFQRVLEKGRFENWTAKDRMEISLGNAGVVELEINGQVFSNLGKRGQALKNIVITKEGLNIGR